MLLNANSNNLVVEATEDNFHTLRATSDPVLLMFSATWCPACKVMEPVIQEIATEFAGSATVAKVEVAANPTTTRYGIRTIPALLVLHQGQIVYRSAGVIPKTTLAAQLSRFVSLKPVAI